MANWTAEDPGRIDSGALGTTATTIQTTETSLGDARTAATTAQSGISDAIWTGDAAAAWITSLSTPIGKIDAVVPAMSAVRDAISSYTTTVDGIKSRAATYTEMIFQANLTANRQFMDPMGGPTSQEQMRRDLEHQSAISDRASAQGLLDGLSEEREAADAALVSALSSPGGDSWDAQQAALAAIGITSAADLTPTNIAQGMADMAEELGHGSFEAELAGQLQSLYALYGSDPAVMAQMNLALGGEDLMSLISRIDDAGANGWLAPGAALLLAQSVRGGLSVGSQRWTSSVGQGFADDLWAGAAKEYGTGSWTGLAFLFGDEGDDTIGLTTTVGLANLADEYERGLPGATEGYPGPGQGILGPDGFLAMAEADQAGYDVNRLGDWTSRVFSTLGEYPEAAMDWLTDMGDDPYRDAPMYPDEPYGSSHLGPNRVEYWFGRRDSSLDGFEGVLAMLAGAEAIPGGPMDPNPEHYSEQAWLDTATLTHDAIHALVGEPRDTTDAKGYVEGNRFFSEDSIGELGSVKLAQVLAPQLSGLVEEPIIDPRENTTSLTQATTQINAFGITVDADGNPVPPRTYANLSSETLARILGIAGSTDGGADTLQRVISGYQETVLGAAELGVYNPADAITRVTLMQAVLDGSTDGADLSSATRHDEAVSSAIDVVETGVGFLPIPGLDKLVGAIGDDIAEKIVSEGAGYVRGQLTDVVSGAATEAWGQSHEDLLTGLADLDDQRTWTASVHAAQMLVALDVVDVPPPTSNDPADLVAWVQDNEPALDAALNSSNGNIQSVGALSGQYEAYYRQYREAAEG